MLKDQSVWIFHGVNGRFSSGVFSSIQKAADWINKYKLSGVLTEYPLNEGVYNWAIENNYFEVKKESQTSPLFIQNFTCAGQEHFHFENGEMEV
jgi:hypothetical protein